MSKPTAQCRDQALAAAERSCGRRVLPFSSARHCLDDGRRSAHGRGFDESKPRALEECLELGDRSLSATQDDHHVDVHAGHRWWSTDVADHGIDDHDTPARLEPVANIAKDAEAGPVVPVVNDVPQQV